LGFSLGVDVVLPKTCTLDCIYCQVGKTTNKTIERKEYVAPAQILSELEEVLKSGKKIDYITLSGSGEPTLNSKMGEIIKKIKKITQIPVAVLTNGTLLTDKNVREELLAADLVMPSLDAATQGIFEKINRPHRSLKIDSIIEGLVEFRKIYNGKFWLELMLVKGVNDNQDELNALKKAVERINPNKIQLNTPARPTCEEDVEMLSEERLAEIKEFFGDKCEIISEFERKEQKEDINNIEEKILELIKRRPMTSQDISSSLGVHIGEVIKYVDKLEKQNKISSKVRQGNRYFQKQKGGF
jgi:wyosine [tRNA(Phe)-imidazoG37] synthetase (radical SAM superfamily)